MSSSTWSSVRYTYALCLSVSLGFVSKGMTNGIITVCDIAERPVVWNGSSTLIDSFSVILLSSFLLCIECII